MTDSEGGTSIKDEQGLASPRRLPSQQFPSHERRTDLSPSNQSLSGPSNTHSWVLSPYHISFDTSTSHESPSIPLHKGQGSPDSGRPQVRPYSSNQVSQGGGMDSMRPPGEGPYYAWNTASGAVQGLPADADEIGHSHPHSGPDSHKTNDLTRSVDGPYYSWGTVGTRHSFDSATTSRDLSHSSSNYNSFGALNSPVEPESYRSRVSSLPDDYVSHNSYPSASVSGPPPIPYTSPLTQPTYLPYTHAGATSSIYRQSPPQHLGSLPSDLTTSVGAAVSAFSSSNRRGSAVSATSDSNPPYTSNSNVAPSGTNTDQDRPYQCDGCPLAFHRNHDLKRHKRIHLEVKPFPCPLATCDKRFTRKDALKRHLLVKQHDVPLSMRRSEEEEGALEEEDSVPTESAGGKAKRSRMSVSEGGALPFPQPPPLHRRSSYNPDGGGGVSPGEEEHHQDLQRPSIHPLVSYSARSGSHQYTGPYSPTSVSSNSNGPPSYSTNATSNDSLSASASGSGYRPPFDRRYSDRSPSYVPPTTTSTGIFFNAPYASTSNQGAFSYNHPPTHTPFESTQSLPILPLVDDKSRSPQLQRPSLPPNISSYP